MNLKIFKAWVCMIAAAAVTAFAQPANYQGPGVLSQGGAAVGNRSGEQVGLRFSAGVNAIYDTGLIPFATDSENRLLNPGGLYGVEAQVMAYGSHQWKQSLLGLNYNGNYRHYNQSTYFSGTNHIMQLGFTHQPSRRITIDSNFSIGSLQQNISFAGFQPTQAFSQNASLLFDNRVSYLQSGMYVNFLQSARNVFTAGGEGFTVRRQNPNLFGVKGYTLTGRFQRRVTREMTLGAEYQHIHYDFPRAFGELDTNVYNGLFSRSLGPNWTIYFQGGIAYAQVQGLENVRLDPLVASILGTDVGQQAFFRTYSIPSGKARLARKFKRADLEFSYERGVNPGNGLYLTSRMENYLGNLSYTASRRWSVSIGGGRNSLSALGQGLQPYKQSFGSFGTTFRLVDSLHLVARYDLREQQIDFSGFRRTTNRVSVGFSFSPGELPLSLW